VVYLTLVLAPAEHGFRAAERDCRHDAFESGDGQEDVPLASYRGNVLCSESIPTLPSPASRCTLLVFMASDRIFLSQVRGRLFAQRDLDLGISDVACSVLWVVSLLTLRFVSG
jgi:hypothetical protein